MYNKTTIFGTKHRKEPKHECSVRSMTGYGRGEHIAEERKFTVEMKSVNHRYNDMTN